MTEVRASASSARVVVEHYVAVRALERTAPLPQRAARLPDVKDPPGLDRPYAVDAGQLRKSSIPPGTLERHQRLRRKRGMRVEHRPVAATCQSARLW